MGLKFMTSARGEFESRFAKIFSYDVDRYIVFFGCLPDSVADADQNAEIGGWTHRRILVAMVSGCRIVATSFDGDVGAVI